MGEVLGLQMRTADRAGLLARLEEAEREAAVPA
jgi:hypothetical protein